MSLVLPPCYQTLPVTFPFRADLLESSSVNEDYLALEIEAAILRTLGLRFPVASARNPPSADNLPPPFPNPGNIVRKHIEFEVRQEEVKALLDLHEGLDEGKRPVVVAMHCLAACEYADREIQPWAEKFVISARPLLPGVGSRLRAAFHRTSALAFTDTMYKRNRSDEELFLAGEADPRVTLSHHFLLAKTLALLGDRQHSQDVLRTGVELAKNCGFLGTEFVDLMVTRTLPRGGRRRPPGAET